MDASNRRDPRVRTIAVGALALVLVAAVVWLVWLSPGAQSRRELEQARETWESREPSSYSFDYAYCGGMCAYCPVHVSVTDGTVVRATRSGRGCATGPVDDALTIEDLFEIAGRNRPRLLHRSSSVSYDDRWGFPATISFTCPPDTTDCGGGWSVSGFADLDRPQPTSPST